MKERLITMHAQLLHKMQRLVFLAKRTRLELKDDPKNHLVDCTVCHSALTRFGVCAICEANSNGHTHEN